jgi:hypothetical protein
MSISLLDPHPELIGWKVTLCVSIPVVSPITRLPPLDSSRELVGWRVRAFFDGSELHNGYLATTTKRGAHFVYKDDSRPLYDTRDEAVEQMLQWKKRDAEVYDSLDHPCVLRAFRHIRFSLVRVSRPKISAHRKVKVLGWRIRVTCRLWKNPRYSDGHGTISSPLEPPPIPIRRDAAYNEAVGWELPSLERKATVVRVVRRRP